VTVVRAPRPDELPRLQDIERAAGAAFVDVGLPDIAADDPASLAELDEYRSDGRAWVVTDDGDRPVAYVLVDLVDGHAHVEQVSVHPDHGRRGLGRRLLDHVHTWAAARGDAVVTLTTFRDVPWNAPYYERCGYRVLQDGALGPGLRALMAEEASHGLDPALRVAMAFDLGKDRRP
jgi:GNAT superfamily N-acetyltransferase